MAPGPITHLEDVTIGIVSPVVRQRLRQQGVTEAGIEQLRRSQQITNPRDRQVLAKITLEAVSGNPSAANSKVFPKIEMH